MFFEKERTAMSSKSLWNVTIYFAIVECCMAVDAGSDFEAQRCGQISYHIYWYMWMCQYQLNQELQMTVAGCPTFSSCPSKDGLHPVSQVMDTTDL